MIRETIIFAQILASNRKKKGGGRIDDAGGEVDNDKIEKVKG